jgi:hypothetical protein
VKRWSREESKLPWPPDVFVQGGDSGIVISRNAPTRRTAFVEAFPPDGFIRGEGETLQEAEDSAWAQYVRETGCGGHEFERRGYRNGAGFCKHCGAFRSKVFKELPPDPDAPKPLMQEVLETLMREVEREGAE